MSGITSHIVCIDNSECVTGLINFSHRGLVDNWNYQNLQFMSAEIYIYIYIHLVG